MATIADVARLAGVSMSTAARVLSGNGYAGARARHDVRAAAEQLGYVPNHIARSLRLRSTMMVGLLIADVENSFYGTVARHVESALRGAGYRVVLCNDNDNADEEREYLTLLEGMGVDGVILTPTPHNRPSLDRLRERGMSIVQIDRHVPGVRCDMVLVDNEQSTRRAISHLIDRGHSRIGMLTGPLAVSTSKERLRGYRRALADHGIPWCPELVRAGSFLRDSAIKDVHELMDADPTPTALFAANNILTEACVLGLNERRARVPREVSVVGFDDLPWMSYSNPPLTTVHQPIAEMATTAAELLLERLQGADPSPRRVVFEASLVVRRSVLARRASRTHIGSGQR